MQSISIAAPSGRTATPTQVRECGCFGKNCPLCQSDSPSQFLYAEILTAAYTSFIGAKSSVRLDRKRFTLRMLLVSVPADLRIFDMFSSAACCTPPTPVSIADPVPQAEEYAPSGP